MKSPETICPQTGKNRLTRDQAMRTARWWRNQFQRMDAYCCRFCGAWHVGHRRIRKPRRVRR